MSFQPRHDKATWIADAGGKSELSITDFTLDDGGDVIGIQRGTINAFIDSATLPHSINLGAKGTLKLALSTGLPTTLYVIIEKVTTTYALIRNEPGDQIFATIAIAFSVLPQHSQAGQLNYIVDVE